MAPPLNALQQSAYNTIQRKGQIRHGQGWRLTTAQALARRALVTLEVRRDVLGKPYFWVARSIPTPTPTPTADAKPAPVPEGSHAIRVGVRHPQTGTVTYTAVTHVHDVPGLRAELAFLGVPERERVHGTGGQYTTEDGMRRYVWRELTQGAVREFVWGGEVFRIQPHATFADTWAVVKADTEEVVAAHVDPLEAEACAKADLVQLNRALTAQPQQPNNT